MRKKVNVSSDKTYLIQIINITKGGNPKQSYKPLITLFNN